MFLKEALQFSISALRANPIRSLLTTLAMAIGTASVILVVTISLIGRDYILREARDAGISRSADELPDVAFHREAGRQRMLARAAAGISHAPGTRTT